MENNNSKFGLVIYNSIPGLNEIENYDETENCFLSVYSPFNNEKVKAQSGAFVIFPLGFTEVIGKKPDDYFLENLPNNNKYLLKIVLMQPEIISQELKQIGVKSSQYYPHMPEISSEVKSYIINQVNYQNTKKNI